MQYFGYQNPLFLTKYVLTLNQFKNNQIESRAIYLINELRNAVVRLEIP